MNDKYVDAATGLAYYGARYYDKTLVGWTQMDPLYRFVPDARWSAPRRGNVYAFTLQNPLRYTDPDGRATAPVQMPVGVPENEADAINARLAANEHEDDGGWYSRREAVPVDTTCTMCFDPERGAVHEDGNGMDGSDKDTRDKHKQLGDMWMPDDLPSMTGTYSDLAKSGAVIDSRFADMTGAKLRAGIAVAGLVEVAVLGGGFLGIGTASGGAVPAAAAEGEDIDWNKVAQIFDQARHGLGPFLERFGGDRGAAFTALKAATTNAMNGAGEGVFETTIQILGEEITVRGAVVDGMVKMGTAFKQ